MYSEQNGTAAMAMPSFAALIPLFLFFCSGRFIDSPETQETEFIFKRSPG